MMQPGHILKLIRWQEGRIIETALLESAQFLIGRNKDAEVPLKDLSVSRRHLVVTVREGEIF